jgi:hypothetical protein
MTDDKKVKILIRLAIAGFIILYVFLGILTLK